MYSNFIRMDIDEGKNIFDLSDHCVIKSMFRFEKYKMKKGKERDIVEYFSVRDEMQKEFISNVERRIDETHSIDMDKFEEIIIETANNTLKKKCIRKTNIMGQQDPIWFTKDMKDGIKLRQYYNRMRRNAKRADEEEKYMKMYKDQKSKVHKMIKEGIIQYEQKVTWEVKTKKNSKELWNNINKLRGKNRIKKEVKIHDENGEILSEEDYREKIMDFWIGIYHKHDNKIRTEWNSVKREEYREAMRQADTVRVEFDEMVPEEMRKAYEFVEGVYRRMGKETNKHLKTSENEIEYMNIPSELMEHYDMVARNPIKESMITKMEEVTFTASEISKQLGKMKSGKKSGPDKLKPEMYKWMMDSRLCLEIIANNFNEIVNTGIHPIKWKNSDTILIPKNNKPKHNELRPLAMTNNSYKLFMSMIKDKITTHLLRNEIFSVYQAGFTKNRRIEDNIFILRYCIAESKKNRKPLYIAAIDFAKAFDSIKRENIIYALKKYKCNPQVIDILAALYVDDNTNVIYNGKLMGNVKVESGIRQGCTGSPLLFVLVLNHIIESIVKSKIGFRSEELYIPVLFFADDGLLISQSRRDLERMIDLLTSSAGEVGLQINSSKSNIMIFNDNKKPREIQKIRVTNEIKYLGVTVNNTANCFRDYKNIKIKSARKMANMTYSVIEKSCNKLLIGKTYWKGVVLPCLLYGLGVVVWSGGELEKLQKVENSVWRCILGAPGYAPITAMRGDIGASTMLVRDIKSKLKYVRYAINSGNKLLSTIMTEIMHNKEDPYVRKVEEYMNKIGIGDIDGLMKLTDEKLEDKARDYDERMWREELESKKTLELYIAHKGKIKEEKFYDNTEESILMFKARSNTLKLNWRKRFEDGNVTCTICGREEETLYHFLKNCTRLTEVRDRYDVGDREIQEILLFEGNMEVEYCKKYVKEAWKRRAEIANAINNNEQS